MTDRTNGTSVPTILVVDDSDLIRGVLNEYLTEQGFHVVSAENGLSGILEAYRVIPDLIISDVEMPRLQGYQLSRLLKSRREICRIPVIMHTSLSEDRDRFWADSSGADAFITKDFDNLEALSEKIRTLLRDADPIDRDTIQEDANDMDEAAALEMMGTLFDRELFQSTILNELSALDEHIGSLEDSARELLTLLGKICEAHVAMLILRFENDALGYVLPTENVFRQEVEGFTKICLRDFHRTAGETIGATTTEVFGTEERQDYEKTRVDGRRISSYHMETLTGKGNEVVGTLHAGNLTNNYFSELITGHIRVFARGAGVVMENAVLFNTINAMKRKMTTMFSKFVPPEVIQELLSKRDDTELQVGEKRSVAILFSDIRSFTVISENNSAEQIVSFLNVYFDRMGAVIREHGGTIDKFLGDAILAVFGAPVSYENNAERALRAAIGMAEELRNIDPGDLVLPESGFASGIGVHEGTVIVGNIGSRDKFDYTVIGDNVNLASRLEGLTKHYQVPIILSDAVLQKIGDILPIREVDTVRVKGKEQPTTLYTTFHAGYESPGETILASYRKGLQLYKMGSWTTARGYFSRVSEADPEDYLSRMYIQRCDEFAKTPPPDDWEARSVLISSRSRYSIWCCLTHTRDEPDLERYFENRAAELVRSLAVSLLENGDTLGSPAELDAFFHRYGLDQEQLRDRLYHLTLAEPLREARPETPQSLVEFLIQDYRLLEQWIIARKGEAYLTLLFGTYRVIPCFAGNSSSIPVAQYLDQPEETLSVGGILVDDGKQLRITPPAWNGEHDRLRSLLENYREYYMWIIVFTE